ncbi:MAG: hypothetical protein ABMB14_38525 [Myxococcota bacterium]
MNTTSWIAALGLLAAGCGSGPAVTGADGAALARGGDDHGPGHDEDDEDDEDEDEDEDDDGDCHDDDAPLYPADAVVEGQTLSQWNARFWEWLVSIPEADSPAHGGDCQQNQGGDVFFLTTTFGDGPAFRSCTVPEHTPIFIPTVTSVIYACPEIWGVDDCPYAVEDEIVPYAQGVQDSRTTLHTYSVTLDGVAIDGLDAYLVDAAPTYLDYDGVEPSVLYKEADHYGAGIPPIDVDCARGFDEDNICDFEPGPKVGATIGHGVILRPLDDDAPHVLHVTGGLGAFQVDVTYDLTVD